MTSVRIAVAGTSGFIGGALCEVLARRAEVVALTRSMARAGMSEPQARIQLRACDHYSRKELEQALQGVDCAVYLVNNWDPSARLDQAEARDRDLLVADNFARAAAKAGVRQIVVRTQLLPAEAHLPEAQLRTELEEVLASHGVPLTVLRTTLVIGPGGELPRLLVRMVRRLPLILLPPTARTPLRPLSLADLLAALDTCVGDPGTFGRTYRVIGPDTLTLHGMVEDTATVLGARPRIRATTWMGPRLLTLLLKALNPRLHGDFIAYLLGTLAAPFPEQPNPVTAALAHPARPVREELQAAVRAEGAAEHPSHQRRDDALIRRDARVRSIQRMHLPTGRDAAWMAEAYFAWLGRLLPPLLKTEREADGSWTVRAHPGRVAMLRLAFKPTHSSPDRVMYFITGGLLAGLLGGRTARLEFRDFMGRFTLVAIHDFNPALPWWLYRFTQAVVHGLVMARFQRHMARLSQGADAP